MNIIFFDELSSTNAYAKEKLNILKHFDVIVADKQPNGYGQWGRKWVDVGCENVYLSIILKPENLSLYTDIVRYSATCICNILLKYDVVPKIKEPNDIIVNNKKICGILAESVTKGENLKGIIVGVGFNLNTTFDILKSINQPSTSLNLETGHKIDKNTFIKALLKEFEENYTKFVQKDINLELYL